MDFIDLAKGICIILVVMVHLGIDIPIPGLNMLRMPLYFVLSGLFFKDYGSFKNFLVKKTNKLLIPFFFFFIVTYTILYLVRFIFPGLTETNKSQIWDLFTTGKISNIPLWFLLGLFWVNIISFFISLVKSEWVRFLLVVICALAGYCTFKLGIQLPLYMNAALLYMPFFYMGSMIKKTTVLVKNRYDGYNAIFIILLYAIACFLPLPTTFSLGSATPLSHEFGDDFGLKLLMFYPAALCMVLALLLLCKMIRRLPLISYIGRYSIIVLCTHYLIMVAVSKFFNLTGIPINIWLSFAIVISGSILMIPICKKLIPWFTAQKDLIRYSPSKVSREAV